jgi:hypothetical protein
MIAQSEAEQRRGGRIVRDETTGKFRVEWDYAKSDDEEQPIAFQKDDETAIDGADRKCGSMTTHSALVTSLA